jgi:dipeptidyl-peptidase 4
MRIAVLSFLLLVPVTFAQSPEIKTDAERSDYQQTTKHAHILNFIDLLTNASPKVKKATYGTTKLGRPLPVIILSDDGISTAAAAKKPVVLVFANIHAGEVDGKEAVLALARDLALKDDAILKKLVLVIAPNVNPDGNEKLGPDNRPGQNGPALTGTRENSDGLDLNRDFVKLDSLEIRSLVKLIHEWNPSLIIDCHTTNGSKHRYTLTYDGIRYPATDTPLSDYTQKNLLPAITQKLKAATGFESQFYGNFNRDRTQWTSYPATPRYGIQYFGLRGRAALLSESYTYASFADRVKASYHFVKSACEIVAEKPDELAKVVDAKPGTRIPLRTKTVAQPDAVTILGFDADGKPKDFSLQSMTKVEPTLEAELPEAYLVPSAYQDAIHTLMRHGIRVEELREQVELDVESYTVTGITHQEREYQKHKPTTLEVAKQKGTRLGQPGDVLVTTAQPLGRLAAYLLEPQAEDGLTTWNFFDAGLAKEKAFPVVRVPKAASILTGDTRPLPELRKKDRPFDLAFLTTNPAAGRGGFGDGSTWLPDGEQLLQTKNRELWKVNARTGRAELFIDRAKYQKSLSALPEARPKGAARGAGGPPLGGGGYRMNKDRTGSLVDLPGGDIGFAYFDGTPAVKLTTSGGKKEFVTFSPTGTHLAFVRSGNLFTVELATKKETALTNEKEKEILNGRADWVYEEEIFNRNGKAYWWSDDGTAIAFLRFDDTPVKKFTLAQAFPASGGAEVYAYPKPGDPNPTVKLGVVSINDPKPMFLPMGKYDPKDTLIARVGWLPDSKRVFAYVQNRVQTWLDFVVWESVTSEPRALFRDSTKAWIDDTGEPRFLADGSFLFLSERTGWKHLYHYDSTGKLLRPITSGDWEIKDVHRIDEVAGLVYFSATKDATNGSNLYSTKLDGTALTRITKGDGTHSVSVAPTGELFTDRFSDNTTPAVTTIRKFTGEAVRITDSNPTYAREEYRFGKYDRVQIPMKDGFLLEAAITYPPDFDATKKYPIWISTYAGPHAPTVRDAWSWRGLENAMSHMGIVSFRVDPRCASGKGAISAWTCYKQMGIQELKDLEEAVDWMCKNSWADASRVGISGHSYGGFMTAFAMTHSKKFAAGIAGAPPTDWRLYDTIYTERYMGLPSENKEGYDKTSVVKAAANLHGRLLLAHGAMDDNVHMQNTMQFIDALQKANKPFEMMIYPPSRHGIIGSHYTTLQLEFIRRTMGVK